MFTKNYRGRESQGSLTTRTVAARHDPHPRTATRRRSRDGTRARPRGAFGAPRTCWVALGMTGATAVLVAIAILSAEVVHALILTIRGAAHQLQFVIEVAW